MDESNTDPILSNPEPTPEELDGTKTYIIDGTEFHSEDSVDTHEVPVPKQVGRYLVKRILGQGGFGRVYAGWDTELERHVAIKVPITLKRGSRRTDLYISEARSMACLDDPHIVPVYDVGSTDSIPVYIVSKFIDGQTLREHSRSSKLTSDDSAQIIMLVARALHKAHLQGIIHRDIKPSNILIDVQGTPYVNDFGLALDLDRPESSAWTAGTPAYMSPEQARGEGHRIDGRSDIFSLGSVFYYLLCGRAPFSGDVHSEVLEQVVRFDPRPPRQQTDGVPRELERICLKAMSKRAADRYSTADDFASDLKYYLADSRSHPTTIQPKQETLSDVEERESSEQEVSKNSSVVPRVVPKGIRSFESADYHFFLDLLPGPRNREGIPDSVEFWRTRIEERDPEETFPVGILYGPSGCGKTSFCRAGLLPLLSNSVLAVCSEASGLDTEGQLLRRLRHHIPELSDELNLEEAIRKIRSHRAAGEKKLLIVIDQFEQWLKAWEGDESSLVAALRQCDGSNVQILLLVRDDFWMAMTRLMRVIEISFQEGRNGAAVDLFSVDHAEKVLTAFGVAYGRITLDHHGVPKLDAGTKKFITQAIEELSHERKVISVRLAIFADMFSDKPWTISALKEVGGTDGVGLAFLRKAFDSQNAPPEYRLHRHAARQILEVMLPEDTSEIRATSCSAAKMLQASGYASEPNEFSSLLRLLDRELRLISSVDQFDPQDSDIDSQDDSASRSKDRLYSPSANYQLTHDYLITPLREWIDQSKRSSRSGRAQLLMKDLSSQWRRKQSHKQLPSAGEMIFLGMYVPRTKRAPIEQQMMKAASRYYLRIFAALLLAFICIGLIANHWNSGIVRNRQIQTLLLVTPKKLPSAVADLSLNDRSLKRTILKIAGDPNASDNDRIRSSLAFWEDEIAPVELVANHLVKSDVTELEYYCDCVRHECPRLLKSLKTIASSETRSDSERLRAVAAFAQISPDTTELLKWTDNQSWLANVLIRESTTNLELWIESLRPIAPSVRQDLEQLFRDETQAESHRVNSAAFLAEYVRDDPDALAELAEASAPRQLELLLPALVAHRERQIELFERRLGKEKGLTDSVQSTSPSLHPDLQKELERGNGLIVGDSIVVFDYPFESLQGLGESLVKAGFSLKSFRPFERRGKRFVAGVWQFGDEPTHFETGSPQELLARHVALQSEGFEMRDVALIKPSTPEYAALWFKPAESFLVESAVYLDVAEDEHQNSWSPLNAEGYLPRTNITRFDSDGRQRFTSLRWKANRSLAYKDAWEMKSDEFPEHAVSSWCLVDAKTFASEEDGDLATAVWWSGMPYESEIFRTATPDLQQVKAAELGSLGYVPVIAHYDDREDDESTVSTVWHRPLPDPAWLDDAAAKDVKRTILLAKLGSTAWMHRIFRQTSDLRAFSIAVDQFPRFEVPARTVAIALAESTDDTVQRGLILALSRYPRTLVPDSAVQQVVNALKNETNPGVSAAAKRCLANWQVADQMPRPSEGSIVSGAVTEVAAGIRMVEIPAAKSFLQGSGTLETGRDHFLEWQHQRTIPRRYAISQTEITVRQFRAYLEGFGFTRYTPQEDSPATSMTWYEAVAFCRWLSEQEDIPEDQMCYPPLDQIGPSMRLPNDLLSRNGFRLPTESEWEYAARGGTSASRYYGDSDRLLDDYAWTVNNSGYVAATVGTRIPNAFGLFDMLGNAMEWCQDSYSTYPAKPYPISIDRPSVGDVASTKATRGGAFLYQPADARSGHRDEHRPHLRRPYLGFRVARTLEETK